MPPWIELQAIFPALSFVSIAGQSPVAVYLGPYLPDVAGAIACFTALLILLKFWQPKTVLGYGGVPVPKADRSQFGVANDRLMPREIFLAWLPFLVLLVV